MRLAAHRRANVTCLLRGLHAVRLKHLRCPLRQVLRNLRRINRRQRPIEQRRNIGTGSGLSCCSCVSDAPLREIVRPRSLAFSPWRCRASAVRVGRNAIDIGSHSVGTNPIGSTMPCLRRLRRSALPCPSPQPRRSPYWRRTAAFRSHSPPALRLGAKIALPRQPRVEVALDRKLSAATFTAATASRLAKRHIKRLPIRRETAKHTDACPASIGLGRLQQRQLAPHRARSRDRAPQSPTHSTAPQTRACHPCDSASALGYVDGTASLSDKIESMLDRPARRIKQQHVVGKIFRNQQLLRALAPNNRQSPPGTVLPCRLLSRRPAASFAPAPVAASAGG